MAKPFTFDPVAFLADFPDLDRALRVEGTYGAAVDLLHKVGHLNTIKDLWKAKLESITNRRKLIQKFLRELSRDRETFPEFHEQVEIHLHILEEVEKRFRNFAHGKPVILDRAAQISLTIEILSLHDNVLIKPGHLLDVMEKHRGPLQIEKDLDGKTTFRESLKNRRIVIRKGLQEYIYGNDTDIFSEQVGVFQGPMDSFSFENCPFGEGEINQGKHDLSQLTLFRKAFEGTVFELAFLAFIDARTPLPGGQRRFSEFARSILKSNSPKDIP